MVDIKVDAPCANGHIWVLSSDEPSPDKPCLCGKKLWQERDVAKMWPPNKEQKEPSNVF